ncbi:TIGR03905 family TSCPD domain-containing protein [Pseudoramibacter porci]|uniref:ribonucleoside-diphosphate reductase n=1 Tax=Pseudoramibacter porci TaxID=2606631 RepID=A0A7X2TA15_9FIRM|nr:TIGR03905 family TSCPD domain-containing protein [Pseudoramibacter porci]MSS19373.1 TIGR03905 family TSCPD domain-containing protein [Pseudoramibacter porci]
MIYKTQGTCSRAIEFDIDDKGIINHVAFEGGCDGNSKGVAALVEGLSVDTVIDRLQGIDCRGRGTSCPDQLAKALSAWKAGEME